MNTISYTNLAKMCAFVEERALTRQSDRTAQLRREAEAAGNTQSSAAQADLLALLVRLTHSSSVLAIGTGAVIESER
ncbi:MAG: methyltransferase, partial [Bifidobacterium mongoliense]|nr:methyltransferase [Bifidobacterium mongoliense]